MSELEIRILSKVSELDDIIEIAGKQYAQTKNNKTLDFVCRRIEARNYLELYIKKL